MKSKHGLGYFAAVDGLRAVAVLSVVLFHLRDSLLPGGYVGVDIFFVISGFVVTASLARVSFDRFRDLLAYFYARRLVRIMPALIVCLVVTFALYVLFLPKSWLSSLTERTGFSAFAGLSNIVLALNEDDYFAPVADYNPFLHTWSLGVEEQFYLVFPFLLFLYARNRTQTSRRRTTLGIIIGAGVASFALCGVLAAMRWEYSFYLLPARFWQLALGMALALTYRTWEPRVAALGNGAAISLTALWILLLAIAFAIPASPRFPFPLAIIPTVATGVAIVLCAARPLDRASRILASPPTLWVGLRSYSLYLWHWPVIVLMRWTTSVDTVPLMIAAVAISVALAAASYSFVEQPFRGSPALRRLPRGSVAIGGVAAALAGAAIGFAMPRAQPFVSLSRTADIEVWQARRDSRLLPGPAGCTLRHEERKIEGGVVDKWRRSSCSNAPGTIYTVGDSHAQGYAPMLRQFALDTGHDMVLYNKSGCAYLRLYLAHFGTRACKTYLPAVTRELVAVLKPGDVLFLPSMRVETPVDQWGRHMVPASEKKIAAAMAEARSVLSQLVSTGAAIVFEAPKPVLGAPVYRCADWYTKMNPICAAGLTIEREAMLRQRRTVMDRMAALANEFSVKIWDPLPALCAGPTCSAFDDDGPLLFDMHHLTNHGNRVLRGSFREYMEPLLAPTPPARVPD